ncbi:MAG: phBC6A51 family helix-turn-helix protein [Candidatus Shapirobacteria bacterium]
MNKTIAKRQTKNKELILKQLKKTPIVQIACERVGIGRATYYRWRKDDSKFTKASDKALLDGNLLVNDMAESQLMSAIKDKNMTAIIFWLKHHHPAYLTRLEITSTNKTEEALNPEQHQAVKKALLMAGVVPQANE